MKVNGPFLALVWLAPLALAAQGRFYLGGMGGVATLSGDASAIVTSASAATSLFDPRNGGVGEAFFGVHAFRYVSFQGDYVCNRNDVALVATSNASGAAGFYRQPETLTQNALLGNVLVYFRRRGNRIRPYLSEGAGLVVMRRSSTSGGVFQGSLPLPPASDTAVSPALRTSVGVDLRLDRFWSFRYSFGETITRNEFGDEVSPVQSRIPKNFRNLFGLYFAF